MVDLYAKISDILHCGQEGCREMVDLQAETSDILHCGQEGCREMVELQAETSDILQFDTQDSCVVSTFFSTSGYNEL